MEPFSVHELTDQLRDGGDLSVEFLRRDSMSLEVYRLPAGAEDPQEPHTEDEAYYVVEGRAKIRIEEAVHPVAPGDVVFVERRVDHSFVDIEEELVVVVFFAPAFGSQTDDGR